MTTFNGKEKQDKDIGDTETQGRRWRKSRKLKSRSIVPAQGRMFKTAGWSPVLPRLATQVCSLCVSNIGAPKSFKAGGDLSGFMLG